MNTVIPELHVHTINSLKDGVGFIDDIQKRCVELGIPAVAITDHGNVMGVRKFYEKGKENGIKTILGVEAYYKSDEPEMKRGHMCLYAVDNEGYWQLMAAVSESNAERHLETVKVMGNIRQFPLMDDGLLIKYFGPGSKGHGHVIATSACVGGVLGQYYLHNERIAKNIATQQKKLEKLGMGSMNAADDLSELLEKAKIQLADRKKCLAESKASKSGDIKRMERLVETSKQRVSQLNSEIKKYKEIIEKRDVIQKSIAEIKKGYLTEQEIMARMEARAARMQEIFGRDNFYIELQYHNLAAEAKEKRMELSVAEKLAIKLCAANDAHYVRREDYQKRVVVETLEFGRRQEEGPDTREYYIKTGEEIYESLQKVFCDAVIESAFEGTREIADRCNVVISRGSHYPVYPRPEGTDAKKLLKGLAYEGIKKRYPGGFPVTKEGEESYEDRLTRELEVIHNMGFDDYLLIVQDYVMYGRELSRRLGKDVCNAMIGYGIGPGRGSGAGSLVNYLIGITNLDPIKYGLLFERFLNPERVSMPDIDVDFSEEIREACIDYVREKYGRNAVCLISTVQLKHGKAAIRDYARFMSINESDVDSPDKTKYGRLADTICKAMPQVKSLMSEIPGPEDKLTMTKEYLKNAFSGNSKALEMIEGAVLLEGIPTGFGVHAAGVIISDNDNVAEHVPIMYNAGKKVWASQCDMVEAEEAFGMLKMDFLGLKNLDILTMAAREIYKRHGVKIDFDNPLEDKAVYEHIISTGMTDGVFQLESRGMKDFMRQLKPDCIEDLIAGVSLYRPGPMDYIPQYIVGKRNPGSVHYECPELEPILAPTYGCIVYQEQVMDIFGKLAGFSLGQADLVRRAMSKKKAAYLEAQRNNFIFGNKKEYEAKLGTKEEVSYIPGCVNNGISEEVAGALFERMSEFAKYAFNKSHAACYAVIAYQTAYLKEHYPEEFYAALMTYTQSTAKLQRIVNEGRSRGIKFCCPDINSASDGYTINENGEIVFSMRSINGINDISLITNELSSNGRFTSFASCVRRIYKFGEKGIINLVKAGCFDNCDVMSRFAMASITGDLVDTMKRIAQKREAITKYEAQLPGSKKKLTDAEKILETLECQYSAITPLRCGASRERELIEEREMLGLYVSGHPTDNYPDPKEIGFSDIGALSNGQKAAIFGYVSDLVTRKRKSDGADMAFFSFDSNKGSINACVFAKEYAQFGNLIKEGNPLAVRGYVRAETYDSEDGEQEEVLKFIVQSLTEIPKPKEGKIIIHVKSLLEWIERTRFIVCGYKADRGLKFAVHDRTLGEIRKGKYLVSREILDDGEIECDIEE